MIRIVVLKILLLLIVSFYNEAIFCEDANSQNKRLGIETQVYPAGFIHGLRFDYNISSSNSVNLRYAYNFARRLDYGRHDNEDGGGSGFSLGYRRMNLLFFKIPFFAGIRFDFWNMNINWQRHYFFVTEAGNSSIKVLQPTIEIGHLIYMNDKYSIAINVSLGMEINYKTQGERVGEGAILLWGASLGYDF